MGVYNASSVQNNFRTSLEEATSEFSRRNQFYYLEATPHLWPQVEMALATQFGRPLCAALPSPTAE